ncbi:hypothetical protein AB0383_23325 [Amycolatopsis sp. NPDC051373]
MFGSVFSALSTGPLGFGSAFAVVFGIFAVLRLSVAVVARKLPDPR